MMWSRDKFVANSSVFFVASFLIGLGNYFFHFLLTRLLSLEDYGEVQSLLAIFGFFAVPLVALSTVLIKQVASSQGSGQSLRKIGDLLSYFTGKVLVVSVLVVFAFLAVSRWLAAFLNLSSVWPAIILGFGLLPTFLSAVNKGVIQGLEKFKSLSLIGLIEILAKISIAVIFIVGGFRVSGAMLSLLASGLIGYLLSFLPLWSLKGKITVEDQILPSIRDDFFLIFSSLLAMNLFFGLDLVLVKHFLPPSLAGQYSGLSLLGRIVFFLVGPIAQVLFPTITRVRNSFGESRPIFLQAIFFTLLTGGFPLALYFLFPGFVIKLLIGSRFLEIQGLLGWFGLAMLSYGLVNLFVQYFLSLGQRTFLLFLGFGALLELVLISLWHQSLDQIVFVINLLMLAILIPLATLYFKCEQSKAT